MPSGKGRVTVSSPKGEISLAFAEGECAGRTSVVLSKTDAIIGRGEDCDVILDGETISRHHCYLSCLGTTFVIQDNSRNGTFVNGQRVEQAQLRHGDQIRVGRNILVVSLSSPMGTHTLKSRRTSALEETSSSAAIRVPHIIIKGLEEGVTQPFGEASITIGRRADCQVAIEADNISRTHSSITRNEDGYYLADLNSSNGTYLNDQRISREILRDGDRIRIGSYTLVVTLRGQDCVLNFKKNTK